MKVLKFKSPGKVNLRLDVMNKRPDGYHELRMLNSAVSIYDDVELEIVERGITVECENDPTVPNGEENIVYKVCKEIMAYSNKNVGIKVKIKKNIPAGSGMGGGSSNAAAVLMGLNTLLKISLPREKLMKIGTRFGADIPFFLFGAPAIATGIGENLTKLKKLPKMPMVIVAPNVTVSTKSVYDKYVPKPNLPEYKEEIPMEYTSKKAVLKVLRNDLEDVTLKKYPIVSEIKDLLIKNGALGAQMTGSGPSVFGIFADKETADKAGKKLESKSQGQWRVFVTENI
ncbi:4-(cytidine 5'-diphospho)-2-C-methyl-D-erythritol kinase [bacterium]|nr:4-(cytidine 5'-diphospho)-2-C-methyl-D-erythritol kinase [bacterium]